MKSSGGSWIYLFDGTIYTFAPGFYIGSPAVSGDCLAVAMNGVYNLNCNLNLGLICEGAQAKVLTRKCTRTEL